MEETREDLLHLLETKYKSPVPRKLIHEKMEIKKKLYNSAPQKRQKEKKAEKRPCQSAFYINDKYHRKCNLEKIIKMYNENEKNSSQANIYVNPNINICKDCKGKLIVSSDFSSMICSDCSLINGKVVDNTSACLSYNDSLDWQSFCYRRINHLSEWLSNCMAKESMQIPAKVLEDVMNELWKSRTPKEKIDRKRIRACLKACGYRKYYENVSMITSLVTGIKPVQLTSQEVDIIKRMFMAIQDSFAKNRPATRSNFLSYSFILFKFCQLLKLNDFAKNFVLLKGKEKLMRQDAIWAAICKDLGWKYIPSI